MSDWWSADPVYSPQKKGTGNFGNAISNIESGGRYDILGPVTRNGDRAYGKYQVMGNNVGPWSEAALGRRMTPEEFRADPDAQDAVFNHRFGRYVQKHGPEGAARAWFAGEGGMNDPGRRDQLGTSVAEYARKFNAGVGRDARSEMERFAPEQPQAMAFAPTAAKTENWWAADPVANSDNRIEVRPSAVDNRFPDPQPENATLQAGLEAAGPAMAGSKGALDAGARGAAQGATFNFYDELRGLAEAGGLNPDDPATLRSILTGAVQYMRGDPEATKRYDAATKRERAETKTAEELHPNASLAGNLVGAVAVPIGGMAGAATTPARIGRGVKIGAAGGAAAGVGAGENEEERISSGVTGAAAGAALGGTVGAVLGRRGMPTEKSVQASDIFSTSKPHYREFKDVASKVEIPAETRAGFGDRLRGALDNVNLTDDMAGAPAKGALKLLEGDNPISLYDLQKVKRIAARGFGSAEKDVRDGAAALTKEITKIINEVSPEAGKALKTADDIQSTAYGLQDLQRKGDVAGLRAGRAGYGGNAVNSMRQVLSPLVQKSIEGKTTGFKPNEIAAMREIVEGTTATNMARQVGALSPSKGANAMIAGGLTGGAASVVGIVGNKLATRMTGKQIERLKELVAKRSPKYEEAVRKSVERYEKAMDDFANGPSSGRLAKMIGASRALSGGLNKDGIQVSSGDLLRLLTAPGTGRADEDEVPGSPSN